MATYVQDGKTIDYTPTSAVDAGQVVVQGDLVGVATRPIAANALGALAVSGVFDFDKDTGSATAISAGAKVYWDAGNEVATTTVGSNKLIGKAIADADADDETVRIWMSQ
jgi:predicted RecA/RadA family phage recombinase